jgi:hypothetical protein
MIATRRALPATRSSLTHKFSVARHEGYLTVGLYEDGSPGEIFIKVSKEGSAISGFCQAFCRAFSLALQLGLSVDEAVVRFKGMRFDPYGLWSPRHKFNTWRRIWLAVAEAQHEVTKDWDSPRSSRRAGRGAAGRGRTGHHRRRARAGDRDRSATCGTT